MKSIVKCLTCEAKCFRYLDDDGKTESYELLPQSDLTKLKEAYEKMSSQNYNFSVIRYNGAEDMLRFTAHLRELWEAIREIVGEDN